MCPRDLMWDSVKVLGMISAVATTVVPASAQQVPASPLAAAPADNRYPDGSRLQAQYASVNQSVALPAASAAVRAAAAGFASAAAVQTDLPDGYSLLPATASHIGAADRQASVAPGANPTAAAAAATEKFITVFPLAYHGVPLSKGSDYLTVVAGDGRVLVTRKRGMPNTFDATQPTVAPAAAVQAARRDAGAAFGGPDPRPELQIWVDDQQKGNLSWTFTLSSGAPGDANVRKYWVAAVGEPRVLNWESEVYHTQSGIVTGNIWATSPSPTTANRALEELEVSRQSDGVTQITGADGRYGYSTAAPSTEIRAKLRGPFFVINNQSSPSMETAQSGPASSSVNLNFGAGGDDQLAQTSAFYWANFARDLAHNILAPTDLANLPVLTNINNSCNAFWNGSSLNFFKAGNNCPNTAYSDVVMHEYGHGIDAAKGGIVHAGYSEGFGDSLAVLATRQPCVGRDFFGPGTCLRPASDVVLWPAASPDPHVVGRPYAGFTWELVQQLKQTFSDDEAYAIAARLVLGAAAANPADVADAVRLSFIVDDNDGNLANGTPHFRAIANAADSRKIPRPADPPVGGPSVGASASFPWTPVKTVNANSNILQATIHLDKPGQVHISADTSASSTGPVQFESGVYNGAQPNVVWTDSYRSFSLPAANQWAAMETKFAIDLPAGDHTIYWKVWIAGGSLSLSSGVMTIEAFEAAGGPAALTTVALGQNQEPGVTVGMSATNPTRSPPGLPNISLSRDDGGRAITVLQ
ncbi:exported hypothetical protein [Bradyrhizobium sp. STM 3843]|uniref:hypothetical protein n=1 Tax=Bradyrhizobium sp. STM 3843 TaxID=551947 RepID=UPI0002403245|nr:hypothetical protein [Bradyrhizobium sp. STM 3843]CCE09503.1 exported hypothetical protein [Bradyrhizobium sp. STM 3843]